MQPEDDPHLDLHTEIEDEVRSILTGTFDDPLCRANVLLRIFYEEFMALDDADDVAELAEDLSDILMSRTVSDLRLFAAVGRA